MKKKFLLILYIFLIIISQLYPFSLCDDINDDDLIDVNAEILDTKTSQEIPSTNSRAFAIIDRKTNTLILEKNAHTKRKMASTTKIMTAILIIENCNLNQTIEISKKAANTGGSRLGLKTGDKITILDLLYGLMLKSGNDAAVALAEYYGGSIENFSIQMNNKAHELNLINTNFETPHGLDSENHYTTAYELAILSNYAISNKTFAQIVGTKNYTVTINGSPKSISNTNELLGNFDGIYGIKTGFTNGANRCLVTACKRNDIDIICVVLGADTKKFRTQDSVKLINYVFNNFKSVNIENLIINNFQEWKNENLSDFKIIKGLDDKIFLKIEDIKNPIILIKKDLIDKIDVNINCNKIIESPIEANSCIGNISVNISENYILNYKIYNVEKIKRKTWNNYFINIFKNYNILLEKGIKYFNT